MKLVRAVGTASVQHPKIAQLCFGGDWACAHGDLSALADIVHQLAERVREPLHCELSAVAQACRSDPDRATELWYAVKDRVLHASPHA